MTFIIAEVGSNWTTFEDAKNSIALAKACGADAVKFQAYDDVSLYGQKVKTNLAGTLPTEWLEPLALKAKACGIEFMCSAFSVELLNKVDPLVVRHKMASAELTHVRMLERLNEIKKPVILSTGASGMVDIERALKVLKDCPVTLLFCVAAYPARYINFEKMNELKKFGVPVGFSDHSTDVLNIPLKAQTMGAVVVEKHVNFVNAQGPDSPHSLNTDEFKYMVKSLRGEPVPLTDDSEKDMITTHNRRLVATQDIFEGDTLKEGVNFGIFRCLGPDLGALSPWAINKVENAKARVKVKAGNGIPKEII